MKEKTEVKTTRRPYRKPQVEEVRLVAEEAVLTGCKSLLSSGPGDYRGLCAYDPITLCNTLVLS